jgi:hypothetical protein
MRIKPDRERLKERWRDVQALSGGSFRLGGIGRHIHCTRQRKRPQVVLSNKSGTLSSGSTAARPTSGSTVSHQ